MYCCICMRYIYCWLFVASDFFKTCCLLLQKLSGHVSNVTDLCFITPSIVSSTAQNDRSMCLWWASYNCSTVQYSTVQPQYSTIQYGTATATIQYSTVQYTYSTYKWCPVSYSIDLCVLFYYCDKLVGANVARCMTSQPSSNSCLHLCPQYIVSPVNNACWINWFLYCSIINFVTGC